MWCGVCKVGVVCVRLVHIRLVLVLVLVLVLRSCACSNDVVGRKCTVTQLRGRTTLFDLEVGDPTDHGP